MRNRKESRLYVFLIVLSFAAMLGNTTSVFAQTLTKIHITGGNDVGKLRVITKLTEAIDPAAQETSVGFFYRLENINTGKSYFWSNTVIDTANVALESVSEILALPNGSYTLVVYQSRKSKPVKINRLINPGTGDMDTIIINNILDFPDLEIVLNGTNTELFSSWNISTDTFPSDNNPANNPEHYTAPRIKKNPAPDENEPWTFITLVKNDWGATGLFTLTYPEFFSFEGIITSDLMWKPGGFVEGGPSNIFPSISHTPADPSRQIMGSVSLQKAVGTTSGQEIVHFIFKNNKNYVLPGLDSNEPVSYKVSLITRYKWSDFPAEIDTFPFLTRPKPHDPNRLTVNKKTLCACGTDEYLTYRIDYLNEGRAPTYKVKVKLMDMTRHLQLSTIQHNNTTNGLKASISSVAGSPEEFIIDYPASRGLPGAKQNSSDPFHPKVPAEECEDYFYIKVKKKDCLPADTIIQPKAMIVFYGAVDTIYTNLDETMLVKCLNCTPCPSNELLCPGCQKKKRCWLFHWFRRKNKTNS